MIGIYLRVSSTNQVIDGMSIEIQKNLGVEFARSLNLEYKIYEDLGKSGGSIEKRKEYQNLLFDIENGIINKLWVRDLSRLNRDLKNSMDFKIAIIKNKVDLFENGILINLDDNQSEFMYNFISLFSDYQRKYSGRLTNISRIRKLEEGYFVLGTIPFGFTRINGKLVKRDSDVEILNKIWDYILEGYSSKKISSILKLKYMGYERDGKKLQISDKWIRDQLSKKHFYTGILKVRFKGVDYDFEVEKLMSEEKFNKIQEIYYGNLKGRREEVVNILEGKLFCSKCQKKMIFSSSKGWKKKDGTRKQYYYLYCNNEVCSDYRKHGINEQILLKDFYIFIEKILKNKNVDVKEEFILSINQLYIEHQKNLVGVDRKHIVKKIERLEEEKERNNYLFFKGFINESQFLQNVEESNMELRRLNEKLKLDDKIYDDKLIVEYLDYISKLEDENNNIQFIIDKIIEKIYVRYVKRDYFEGGYRIFYKINFKYLGVIDNYLRGGFVNFILVGGLFLNNMVDLNQNLSFKNTFNTNKVLLNKRFLKLNIEFVVLEGCFQFEILDIYLIEQI